ncbi:MAG: NTP/NDP exchange transporter [Alphaproteobacteria bacterium]|nr:NTP/NDP exchange transporter [Alphaproteobacteria bacterium]
MLEILHKKSTIKFFLFGLLLFSLYLAYFVLRETKTVILLAAPAWENIFFFLNSISFFVKLVFLGLFFLFYRRNNLPQILFVSTISFLILFILFHFWGFQNVHHLHPNPDFIQELLKAHTEIAPLISAYGVWSFSCYYLLAEMWGTFTITFLFWAFANQTFTLKESKLSYLFLFFIFPSRGALLMNELFPIITSPDSILENTMQFYGYILLGGLILFILGMWLIKKNKFMDLPSLTEETAQMPKISTSFKCTYFFLIFVIITSLGVCEKLTNLLFRVHLKNYVSTSLEYAQFMSQYSNSALYFSSLIFLLIFWLVWKYGWLKSALIFPIYLFITTCMLLIYIYFPSVSHSLNKLFISELVVVFWFFTIQSLMFSGLKTLFLITKEIAYIPLAATTKVRGKSITDFLFAGMGVWLGTSSVSLFSFSPINKNIESILLIITGTTIVWILSVVFLGKMFSKITQNGSRRGPAGRH